MGLVAYVIREVLVNPRNAHAIYHFHGGEPSGVDVCGKLLKAVDMECFGFINMIACAHLVEKVLFTFIIQKEQ